MMETCILLLGFHAQSSRELWPICEMGSPVSLSNLPTDVMIACAFSSLLLLKAGKESSLHWAMSIQQAHPNGQGAIVLPSVMQAVGQCVNWLSNDVRCSMSTCLTKSGHIGIFTNKFRWKELSMSKQRACRKRNHNQATTYTSAHALCATGMLSRARPLVR